jgi:hypothetical protein
MGKGSESQVHALHTPQHDWSRVCICLLAAPLGSKVCAVFSSWSVFQWCVVTLEAHGMVVCRCGVLVVCLLQQHQGPAECLLALTGAVSCRLSRALGQAFCSYADLRAWEVLPLFSHLCSFVMSSVTFVYTRLSVAIVCDCNEYHMHNDELWVQISEEQCCSGASGEIRSLCCWH